MSMEAKGTVMDDKETKTGITSYRQTYLWQSLILTYGHVQAQTGGIR